MSAGISPRSVLVIEPWWGGSHRAFLEGWRDGSRHHLTFLTLPARKWKWRLRHAAVTCAAAAAERVERGERFDAVFASSMLNLAEWKGLAPARLARLPAVAYFHENQLTYPVRVEAERDLHFAFTNLTTALAADLVGFNSAFHRDDFLAALPRFLRRMPDCRPRGVAERIRARSWVLPQGVRPFPPRQPRPPGPLRILWAARWEHDKNPEDFFAALEGLRGGGADFRLRVVGEQFRRGPAVFERARREFAEHIDAWGWQPTRAAYEAALLASDVVVSTAHHEFFGVSVVEAIAAGCFPLLPERLAYPELLSAVPAAERRRYFYDGSVAQLAERLAGLTVELPAADAARRAVADFTWPRLWPRLDAAVEAAWDSGSRRDTGRVR